MHVLVIDDDATSAQLVAMQIQQVATPTVITEGFDALPDIVDWMEVDAVLVDLHLGTGIYGSALLAWLEREHPHITRVLLTADAYIGDAPTHAHTVLLKPASMSSIRAAVGL